MSQTQTDIQSQGAKRTQQGLPTGVQIYDAIMKGIEPELMSANLSHLDDAYPHETEQHHAERYKRYTAAFARYDEIFEEWKGQVHAESAQMRRQALERKEQQSRTQEEAELSDLESKLADGIVSSNAS